MGRRLQRWRALDGRDRWRLIGCVVGLWFVHASLAVFGYGRTRRMIERVSRRTPARAATPAEIADAQALARLAASAGANALGEATCNQTWVPNFPNCIIEVMPNAGHYPMDETPVALATVIEKFLREAVVA